MRILLPALTALWLASAPAAASDIGLLIMDPEIDGDLAPAGEAAWRGRLDLLRDAVTAELGDGEAYAIVPPDRAAVSLAKHERRRGVFDCRPCAVEAAAESGAARTLSIRVFRMSALVLSMQAKIRDGGTGAVRFERAWDFRGDTEKSWLRAGAHMTRAIEGIPPAAR